MRRAWIEGAALLAAHDLPSPPPKGRGLYAPRRAALAADIRYALVRSNPHDKPLAFADIDALARRLQRERGLRGLELVDVADLECRDDVAPRPGVTVFALDADGGRDALIGHAWLDGLGVDHLKAALRRNRLVVLDDDAATVAHAVRTDGRRAA